MAIRHRGNLDSPLHYSDYNFLYTREQPQRPLAERGINLLDEAARTDVFDYIERFYDPGDRTRS